MSLYSAVLFLHVLLAIAVFGPPFIFPILASKAREDPRNMRFALSVYELIVDRWMLPGAALLFLAGVALILIGSWDLWTAYWLDLSIVLFLIAMGVFVGVQRPLGKRMLHLAGELAQNPKKAAAAQLLQVLGGRQGKIGLFLTLSIVVIVYLMVAKPI